jgi:hypothetical protein
LRKWRNAWRRWWAGTNYRSVAAHEGARLTGIDVIYVARQVIPPVYLVDTAAEVVLIAGWAFVLVRKLRAGNAEAVLKERRITAVLTNLSHAGSALEQTPVAISSIIDTWLWLRDIVYRGPGAWPLLQSQHGQTNRR